MSDVISYSDLRANLKAYLDAVCSEHAPLKVRRRNGEGVVILSEDDFSALEETAYLLRSPANARRLLQALFRKKRDRIAFASLAELKREAGI
jgi:antitoxin YefM